LPSRWRPLPFIAHQLWPKSSAWQIIFRQPLEKCNKVRLAEQDDGLLLGQVWPLAGIRGHARLLLELVDFTLYTTYLSLKRPQLLTLSDVDASVSVNEFCFI
jgi:hypothetical protein